MRYTEESEYDESWLAAADADRAFLAVGDNNIVVYDMLTTDQSLTKEGVEKITAAVESSDVRIVSLTPVAGRFKVDGETDAEAFVDRIASVVRDSTYWKPGQTFEAAVAE
ncbi:hypothetical protein NJ7G_0661 [Natrinema sp. J7-2]|nr:hypothetical protein NJ7G_0661 [Natrinema sp. J7-2]